MTDKDALPVERITLLAREYKDATEDQLGMVPLGHLAAVLRDLSAAHLTYQSVEASGSEGFQARVQPWMMACFGAEISGDIQERNHRFLEEANELAQAGGCTRSEAHQLVDYVYDRAVGELHQEVGGVMVTLAALCLANGLDMHASGETELARIWTKVEAIRAKQAAKPKHSPLPQHIPAPAGELEEMRDTIALALINEKRRFANRSEPLSSLDGLESHQKRDELRYANAVLAALRHPGAHKTAEAGE